MADRAENKVCVIGDILLDKYTLGTCARISPEAPVPVVDYTSTNYSLGGAANVAKNIKDLSGDIILCGFIGDDNYGNILIDLLNNLKIEHSLVKLKNQKTLVKERIVVNGNQMLRVDYGKEYINEDYKDEFIEICKKAINYSRIIVLSDYLKGTLFDPKLLIDFANERQIKTIVDPKSKQLEDYKGAYIVKPNINEMNNYLNYKEEKNRIKEISNICKNLSISYILNTQGSEGMKLYDKDGILLELKSKAKTVYDVTGAGDTVIATLATSFIENINIKKAVERSNQAAAIVVSKFGTESISREDLDLKTKVTINSIYFSSEHEKLLHKLNSIRKDKETIVFTNGVFDLIHKGHLFLLSECSKLGDYVIVGVNSDSSVKTLGKGINRPINSLNDRMEVLASLKNVDLVCEFIESTPYNLIKRIKPNILVKGGDYEVHNIVGRDIVESNGGEVISIKYLEGFSTTSKIKKMSLEK